jgi:hypothetical protein
MVLEFVNHDNAIVWSKQTEQLQWVSELINQPISAIATHYINAKFISFHKNLEKAAQ